jgi:hypothetical protein
LLLPSLAVAEPADVPAEARGCGRRAGYVLVEAADLPSHFEQAVIAQLRAGLQSEELDACVRAENASATPVAVVSLRPSARDVVTIEVRHAERTLSREIHLARVPADGRALALAVGADELIRAALADGPRIEPGPKTPAPALPKSRFKRPIDAWRTALGAGVAAEHYAGGQRPLGLYLAARHRFADPFYFRVALGLRRLKSVDTAHGEIAGTAWGAELGLGVTGLSAEPLALSAELGVLGARAAVEGKPARDARGSDAAPLFAVARAGLAFDVRVTRGLALELRGGVGAPLRALHLQDTGVTKTALSGLELYGSFGPNWVF